MKKFRIPISIQILFFLVVVAFIPVAAMMILNTYEQQLLSLTENSNVQQARVLSASLSAFEKENISKEDALNILKQMNLIHASVSLMKTDFSWQTPALLKQMQHKLNPSKAEVPNQKTKRKHPKPSSTNCFQFQSGSSGNSGRRLQAMTARIIIATSKCSMVQKSNRHLKESMVL